MYAINPYKVLALDTYINYISTPQVNATTIFINVDLDSTAYVPNSTITVYAYAGSDDNPSGGRCLYSTVTVAGKSTGDLFPSCYSAQSLRGDIGPISGTVQAPSTPGVHQVALTASSDSYTTNYDYVNITVCNVGETVVGGVCKAATTPPTVNIQFSFLENIKSYVILGVKKIASIVSFEKVFAAN